LQAIESVINFRVRLEDVHCESNEVIFSQVWQLDNKLVSKEKCQRKTESSILTGKTGTSSPMTMANQTSALWGYKQYPLRKERVFI